VRLGADSSELDSQGRERGSSAAVGGLRREQSAREGESVRNEVRGVCGALAGL
jgi:hypothetical protein